MVKMCPEYYKIFGISYLHFTALGGLDSVLERPLYGAKRPQDNYCFSTVIAEIMIIVLSHNILERSSINLTKSRNGRGKLDSCRW